MFVDCKNDSVESKDLVRTDRGGEDQLQMRGLSRGPGVGSSSQVEVWS